MEDGQMQVEKACTTHPAFRQLRRLALFSSRSFYCATYIASELGTARPASTSSLQFLHTVLNVFDA